MKACMSVWLLMMMTLQSQGQQTPQIENVVFYYPDGQVKLKGTTKDGKKEGVSYAYYESGKKRKENNWKNDIQIGKTTEWFENGVIDYKGQLKDGKEDGKWKYYNDIDGKYIYSVYYKNGEIVKYHFSRNKYSWRKIDLPQIPITFDFPGHIFDSAASDSYSCYWTMFPWKEKGDIEFYSLIVIEKEKQEEVDQMVNNLLKDKSSYTKLFSNTSEQNTFIPSPETDRYTIQPVKKRLLKNREVLEFEIKFYDFDISLSAIFIPVKTKMCILSVYYNNRSQNEICKRFLNSVDFKE
ncbi:toxin-antitoxin system YwqK family antitoxin [Taibaiella koreensis]|uniref:toxin-antitoxin system YwqK family antitoxin n=1 Tax=Taibaiella koreensis TaxID=1268548 RepID=UPI0013C322EF|nr:hypothetical protein [Taibaiella koreensis]